MDDLKEKRKYWNWIEEALNHTLWRTHQGRGHGRVTRQTMQRMNDSNHWDSRHTNHICICLNISAFWCKKI